jgi:hypothetical protein
MDFNTFSLLVIIILGIYLVYVSIKILSKECPVQEVKYIPVSRTFEEERQIPVNLQDLYGNLWTQERIIK